MRHSHRTALISSLLILLALAWSGPGCGSPESGPRQPIAFSHKIHAGQNKIACQYCHGGVRRTTAAGIPSERLCMGCHKLVAATRPEIVRLREKFEKKEPIAWLRVNDIPDFVYFNHSPHIARGFECKKCHGDIQNMTEVHAAINLASMSWCVDCHRQNNASVDCYTCHR